MRIFFFLVFAFSLVASGQVSQIIEREDGQIHYRLFGSGEPILIINGGPGFSSSGFTPIAKELAALGYQSILYDQRGTGKSTLNKIDESTITVDLMADDIEVLRKHLGFEEWIVFGHSFGGMLASYYTSKYPDRVEAIIYSATGGVDLHLIEDARINLEARLSPAEIDSLRLSRERFVEINDDATRLTYNRHLAKAYLYHDDYVETVSKRLMEGDLSMNRMVWNNMRSIDFDCKEALSLFRKPVLILQGKQDVLSDEVAIRAHGVFPNSELYFIDKCGHYGWLDQKEEYIGRIKTFLKELRANN